MYGIYNHNDIYQTNVFRSKLNLPHFEVTNILVSTWCYFFLKEESLRGRPGYEHLNEQLHILIEAELPVNVVDVRLRQAQDIIEELLKPVVFNIHPFL